MARSLLIASLSMLSLLSACESPPTSGLPDGGCPAGTFIDNGSCAACSAACPSGSYQTTECSATADRTCAICTALPSCASATCTTATDQRCTQCAAGTFRNGDVCTPCAPACGEGQYETTACSATADRVCSGCANVAYCTTVSCTAADTSTCTACQAGYFLQNGACVACSASCPSGKYQTAACSATADLACADCTAIADCAAETCTTASDQTCTACGQGHYLSQGACVTCSGACPNGQQQSAACTATTDRACTSCTIIDNCTTESCTTTTDQTCSACAGGYYLSNNACVACSGACAAGDYQSAACGATSDRTCSSCTNIAHCTSLTCTGNSNSQCAACTAGYFLQGNACVACSGACSAGEYQTAACSANADRVCSSCTSIGNCASSVSCTTSTDQQCGACAASYFLVDGVADTCSACSGACGAGEYESAMCSATADRSCSSCSAIADCAVTPTCTSASDQQCSACTAGHYLIDGTADTCGTCSGACASGSYQSAACSSTADRSCSTCTAVANCASAITCTGTGDSQCTACAAGYYLVDGTADTCAPCSVSACPAGQYESSACSATADRQCSSCAAIDHCASSITCTTGSDSQCTACAANYQLFEGTADVCAAPTTCADLLLTVPSATNGLYTIDPDGPGTGLAAFSVYCDMTSDGGGWTLVGKVGKGQWPELSQQQYIDLIANPITDIGSAALQNGTMPATKEIDFLRRDKTNAIYHATPYVGESAVRVIFDSAQDDTTDGTYFQQRKVADAGWDFWAALRDSRLWSTQSSVPDSVSNFGTDFVLTHVPASFDVATNSVTQDTGGDTSFGWWDSDTYTLADGSTLSVSRHAGLLCDGAENRGWLWLMTTNSADGRFKNEAFLDTATIWLR